MIALFGAGLRVVAGILSATLGLVLFRDAAAREDVVIALFGIGFTAAGYALILMRRWP